MAHAKKANPESERLRNELAEMESLAKRVQADFANFRRRAEEERGQQGQIHREEVLRRLLPTFDNFERAFGSVPAELEGDEWVQGLLATRQQYQAALEELGVERIRTENEQFDAGHHEALAQSADPGKGDGEITEEFESGWKLGERVIRPAKVRVNKVDEGPERSAAGGESKDLSGHNDSD